MRHTSPASLSARLSRSSFTRHAARIAALGALLCGFVTGNAALAQAVNLTVAGATPSSVNTLVPFTFSVRVGNSANPAVTAVNATFDYTLPAILYNVSVLSSTSPTGAVCPTVASFAGTGLGHNPPALYTAIGEHITATIPSLPVGTECVFTFQATSFLPGGYTNTFTAQPAAPQTEAMAADNTSTNNFTVNQSVGSFTTTKTVLTAGPYAYGAPIRYRISFANTSALDIPYGYTLLQDAFNGLGNPVGGQVYGGGTVTTTNVSCSVAGVPPGWPGSWTCAGLNPIVVPSAGYNPLGYLVYTSNATSAFQGFPAGASFTIDYDVTYTAPQCGDITPTNTAYIVFEGSNGNPVSNNRTPDASVTVGPLTPLVPACLPAPVTITASKVQLSPVAPSALLTTGDAITWRVTIGNAALAGSPTPTVRLLDAMGGGRYGGFSNPLSGIIGSQVLNCTASGGATCPAVWTSFPVTTNGLCYGPPYGPTYQFLVANCSDLTDVSIPPQGSLTFDVQLTMKANWPSLAPCRIFEDGFFNRATGYVVGSPPAPYDVWDSGNGIVAAFADSPLFDVTPDVPVCQDVTANKSVSQANVAIGQPFSFTLDYTNASTQLNAVQVTATQGSVNATTVNNWPVSDDLGANFVATAATCTLLSGTGTAPAVSLANISGSLNTFNASIPSLDYNGVVRCTITGSVTASGGYSNFGRAATVVGSGRNGYYDNVTGNNSSQVNYSVVAPATVTVSKTVSGATAGHVLGTTFPMTLACTVTLQPSGAVSSYTRTLPASPGSPANFTDVPPTLVGQQAVACTVTEGSLPAPAAGYAWGTPTISPATFAAPSSGLNQAVAVDNPLTALTGTLTIAKTISGAPGGYVPATGFSVFATCSLPSTGTRYPTVGFVSATTATPASISNIPAGASCTIDEDVASLPAAAPNYTWSAPSFTQPAGTIPAGGTLNGGSVANSMTANPAGLTVTKTITGAPASVITSALSFPFTVDCSTPPANYNGTVSVAANALLGNSAAISIPAGSTNCTITEGALPGAPAGYRWAAAVNYTQPAAGALAAGGSITGSMGNTLQSGSLTINKTLNIPLPVAATFDFTLNCVAPNTTPTTTALGLGVSTNQSIALAAGAIGGGTAVIGPIAAGSTCSVTESAPTAITNYKWGTTPAATTGLIISNSAAPTEVPVANVLTPLDPPFIKKSSRLIDATTIEWTITVINNSANNAGQGPIAFNVTDAIPGNASIVLGSLSCTPTGTPGQTAVSSCAINLGNTANLSVTGTLAYTNATNANASTALERVDIVFKGAVGPGQLLVNNACADLQNVLDTPVCAQTIISTPPLPVPTLDNRALAALMLMLGLLATVFTLRGQQRRDS